MRSLLGAVAVLALLVSLAGCTVPLDQPINFRASLDGPLNYELDGSVTIHEGTAEASDPPTTADPSPTPTITPSTPTPDHQPTPPVDETQPPTSTVDPTRQPTATVAPTSTPMATVAPTSIPTATAAPTKTPVPTVAATQQPSTQGVPHLVPQYGQSVEQWWASNPFNPSAPSSIPVGGIGHPSRQINVKQQYSGNLQAAIDAVGAEGATLILDPGSYGSARIVGKSHIHMLAPQGNANIAHLQVLGSAMAEDYATYSQKVYSKDPAYLNAIKNPARDFYFNNVTFNGGSNSAGNGGEVTAFDGATIQDVVFDNVTFMNYQRNTSYHYGMVSADRVSDNIWIRNSRFVGYSMWATYFDGVHNLGILNSTIEGGFGSGGLLLLINDDFTNDYDGGGISGADARNMQYVAVVGNTFGAMNEGINIHGAHTIVANNTVQAREHQFIRYNGRCSPRWAAINGFIYQNVDNVVRNNRTADQDLLVLMDNSSGTLNCPSGLSGQLGQYTVKDNTVTGAADFSAVVQEIGTITPPNTVTGNTVNGQARNDVKR